MDIELYNYCTVLFHNYKHGKLENIVEKNKLKSLSKGAKAAKAAKGNQVYEKNEGDVDLKGINASLVLLTMAEQPPGVIFERNNADFMNNFYVDIVCRAFTNIEEIHRQAQENKELNKQNSALRELKDLSAIWKADIDRLVEQQFNQYDTQIITKHKQLEAEQENEDWEKLNRELTSRKSLGSQKLKGGISQSLFGAGNMSQGMSRHDDEREEPMFHNLMD